MFEHHKRTLKKNNNRFGILFENKISENWVLVRLNFDPSDHFLLGKLIPIL